jgi:sugar/nucleoside kinase (ribokinase family)
VGADLPAWAWDWLRAAGIDTAGMMVTGMPTLRARQHFDSAGRRRHEWLVPGSVVGAQLARAVAALPAAYRAARGWHLGLHPDTPDLDFLAGLRALGGALSVEPFKPADQTPAPGALQALLSAAGIFSPNRAGAESLVGPGEPLALLERLAAAGAAVVVLRLGAEGSLVCAAGQAARIPALPVRVVDPVGAGNAYCGGFLTGWVETGDVVEAGLRGAVAASFILEQVGLPAVTPAWREIARERRATLQPLVQRLA